MLIVTDGIDVAAIAPAAHALGLHERGGVLPLPTGPNERGARLCGLAGGGDDVLAAIEAGTVQALVLIGVDPTAEWPEAEPLADRRCPSCASVITVSPFVNTSVSWSHIVLPQAVDYEREGTTTNLEGRIQRLRPAAKPPSGVPDLAAYVADRGAPRHRDLAGGVESLRPAGRRARHSAHVERAQRPGAAARPRPPGRPRCPALPPRPIRRRPRRAGSR